MSLKEYLLIALKAVNNNETIGIKLNKMTKKALEVLELF